MEQSFDLTNIAKGMVGTVPLWLFAWAVFRMWLTRSAKNNEKIEKQFSAQNEAISSIHEKLNRIEIRFATQGVDSLKTDLEELKKEAVRSEMKIDAIFRQMDLKKVGA